MPEHFDIVILGAGSTAFAAGLRASEMGKNVAMIESRTLGGTCANRGCLPSKNLIEASNIFYRSQNPRYPGLRPSAMELDFPALIKQKDEIVQSYREKKYQSIVSRSERIRVIDGSARFSGDHQVTVNDKTLTGSRFLIATGSSPNIPDIPGLSATPYITSDLLTSMEDVEMKDLPTSLIIVGGGYIALELGQMFSRFGTEVTILERGDRVLSAYEPEISQSVMEAFREDGIKIHTTANITNAQGDAREIIVTAQIDGREQGLRSGRLLLATGRRPNTHDLGLESTGVQVDQRGFIVVNDELRTSADHIFAAGDVIGPYSERMATPVGAQDGGIAAENAFSGARLKVNHRVIPRAIFTDPQVGVIGLSEGEANNRGHQCDCRTVPMSMVPRAGAVRDTRGIIKMVADLKTHEVLGVSMHGLNASEVIHEGAMALRFGAKVDDFARMLHVFPTMSEALKIVALAYTKDVSKMSCCAD
ncbi:MAG: mercury(II) reductase [Bryobacteraceae bacterium]